MKNKIINEIHYMISTVRFSIYDDRVDDFFYCIDLVDQGLLVDIINDCVSEAV